MTLRRSRSLRAAAAWAALASALAPAALLGLLGGAPRDASAQSAPSRPRRVSLTIAAPADQAERIVASLGPSLARQGLLLDARPAADDPGLLARVRIDLGPRPLVSVVDAQTGKTVLSRQLAPSDSTDVHREEAVLVVLTALEGMLEPAPSASASAPASASASPPASAPASASASLSPNPASSGIRLEVSALAAAGLYARGAGIPVGGALALTVGRGGDRGGPSLQLLAQANAPVDAGEHEVELRASTGAVRLVPALAVLSGPSGRLDLGLGAGLSIVRVSAPGLPQGAVSRDDGTRASPLLVAMASGRLEVSDGVALTGALLGDLDLARRRYVVTRGQDRVPELSPFRLRPTALVGLSFTLAGGP